MDDTAELARIEELAKQKSDDAIAELAALSKTGSAKVKKAGKLALEKAAPSAAATLARVLKALPKNDAPLTKKLRELEAATFPSVPVFARVLAERGAIALSYACATGGELCKRALAAATENDVLNLSGISPLPDELAEMPVKSLSLGGAKLGTIPECVLAMPQLEQLHISRARIRQFGPEVSQLKTLRLLQLLDTPLTTLDNLEKIPSLRELSIYRAKLKSVPDAFATAALEVLRIVQCPSVTSVPPVIPRMRSLRVLELDHCALTTLDPALFDLVNLEHLDVSGAKIGALPPEIGKLTKLVELQLRGAGVTSLPAEIAACERLAKMDLVFNGQLTLDGLGAGFYRLAALKELRIEYTAIPEASWADIQQKLPALDIYK